MKRNVIKGCLLLGAMAMTMLTGCQSAGGETTAAAGDAKTEAKQDAKEAASGAETQGGGL